MVAYKNLVGQIRVALRAVGQIEAWEQKRKKKENARRARGYRHALEQEL